MNIKRANMKKALLSLSIVGLSALTAVQAQQTPLSNFYNFNEYLINPAQAGYRNQLEGSASHRIQWQGIDGAPKTTFFGVHGALNNNMGLGVKLNVDQTDILQQFNAAVSYAYRIMLNEKSKLNFGVSGMAIQNSINYGDAVIGDYADDVINGGDQSGMTFDAEVGLMYEYSRFKLGIASSHLFESDVNYDIPEDGGTGTFERVRQFIVYSSYQFTLNENWSIEPFALIRSQGPSSFQFEINALSAYNETLFLGAGFRQEAGYIGRVGFQITDQLMAAYAYEFGNTGVASYSGGSHEFMLGYNLGKMAKKEPKINKELAPNSITEDKKSDDADGSNEVEVITGKFNYDNQPQANTTLLVFDESGVVVDTLHTDSNGDFSYEKMKADNNYTIKPLIESDFEIEKMDLFTLESEGEKKVHYGEENIEVITGQFNYDKQPQANTTLLVFDESGVVVDTLHTDSNGDFSYTKMKADNNYTIKPLIESDFEIEKIDLFTIESEGEKKVHYGEENIEVITGQFNYDNQPQANTTLLVFNENGIVVDTLHTDSNGDFTFKKLKNDKDYSFIPMEQADFDLSLVDIQSTDEVGVVKVHSVSKVDFDNIAANKTEEKPKKEVVKEEFEEVGKLEPEVFEKDIKFEFEGGSKESSTIDSNPALDKIATYLANNPHKKVRLKGHTCNMGSDEVNTYFSLQRANTVKEYLLSKGVKENQIEVKLMLDTEPLMPNTSIPNRQQNRRVEIEMIN